MKSLRLQLIISYSKNYSMDIKTALRHVTNGATLNCDEMETALLHIIEGLSTDIETAAFLTALQMREITSEEITGAVRAIQKNRIPFNAGEAGPDALDCCGTGGDGHNTYNISTAVSLVVAACGVPMVKHGNRSASSACGTADVLEALGLNIDADVSRNEAALKDSGFAFLMASKYYPELARLAPLRKALGFRTLFNVIGPLANPAGAKRQLVGVYKKSLMRPVAEALRALGTKRAWIVHGADGLDEITLNTATYICKLENDTIAEHTLTHTDFGLPEWSLDSIKGGDVQKNAHALTKVLDGQADAYADYVCANASAALCVAEKVDSLKDGVSMARNALASGAAKKLFETYKSKVANKHL